MWLMSNIKILQCKTASLLASQTYTSDYVEPYATHINQEQHKLYSNKTKAIHIFLS